MNTSLRRRSLRGVTLFEVLIVVAIIALVSAGVAVGALGFWTKAQCKTAATNARQLRSAVKAWWVDHDPKVCPTLQDLKRDGTLDTDSPATDPWGTPWQIECTEEPNATVTSHGPDRQAGNADDIRIPPA
jgi:general secretion pathway protein G